MLRELSVEKSKTQSLTRLERLILGIQFRQNWPTLSRSLAIWWPHSIVGYPCGTVIVAAGAERRCRREDSEKDVLERV